MKMKNDFSKSLSSSILLFSLLITLSIMSCQKENLKEITDTQIVETPVNSISMEETILIHFFRAELEGLSGEEIDILYEQRMNTLSENDQNTLVDVVEKSFAQLASHAPAANTRSGASSTTLSAGNSGDGFGQSVLTVGNQIFVGAPTDQKVYVYAKMGSSYSLQQEITPTGASDDFGYQIAASGPWLAVSAPDFGQPFGRPGQVFLFKRQGQHWVQKDILNGPAGEVNFGGDGVAMQGKTLAIISRGTGFPSPGGTITVFKRMGNNWSESASIFRPTFDWLALDINDTGNRIAATGFVGNFAGNVRASVFVKSGSSWDLEGDLFVPSPVPFAYAIPRDVAISGGLGELVLTALLPGNKQWYFKNHPINGWELVQDLDHPSGAPFTNRWVDMSGHKIVIGAASNNDLISDAVHVFEKTAGPSWTNTETLTPDDNGVGVIMWSVDVSGNTIVAGCPGGGFIPPFPAGNAYVFE